MKKIIAILVAALMLMAFVPCALATDLTVLTAESITADNEPATAVTKKLVLPSDFTWVSSDPSVIDNDGTVHRDASQDKKVTLTANNGTSSKSFDFTVLSKNSEVVYSNNFYYPEHENNVITTVNGWSYLDNNGNGAMASTIKVADGNYNFNMKRVTRGTNDRIKYSFPDGTGDGTTVRFRINATGGNFILRFDTDANVNTSEIKFVLNSSDKNYNAYYGNKQFVNTCGWSTGWVDVELKFDFSNSKVTITSKGYSSGGSLTTRTGTYDFTGTSKDTCLTQMVVMPYRNDDVNTEYNMDDFTVIKEIDYLATLTDAEKVAIVAEQITAESISSESLASISENLTLYDDDTYANVVWRSSDETVVSDKGVVAISDVSKPVTMTATITSGEKSVEKKFDLIVKESGTSNFYNLVEDFDGLSNAGLSNSSNSTLSYELSDKDSTNVAKFITTDSGTKWVNLKTTSNNSYTGNIRRYIAEADIKFVPNDGKTENDSTLYGIWFGGATPHAEININTKGNRTSIRTYGETTSSSTYQSILSSPDANKWNHIKIDLNLYAQTYDFYVGNEKMFSTKIADADIVGAASSPMRGFKFSITKGGTLYLDNISVREYTDDASKVNAAIIQAKEYAQILHADGENLPVDANDTVYKKNVSGEVVDNIIENDAVITWKFAGADKTAVESNSIGEQLTYTVTASKGTTTITEQVVLNTAPVRVVSVSDTAAELVGALAGKTAIIAVYNADKSLGDVRVVDAANANFDKITVSDDSEVRVFVIDSLTTLKPASYVFKK